MNKITLTELKELAFSITKPILVQHLGRVDDLEPLSKEDISELEKSFDMNNGIVVFFLDGIMYVIPYMENVWRVLNENHFSRKSLYVPFSNGDYPLENREEWENLRKMAE